MPAAFARATSASTGRVTAVGDVMPSIEKHVRQDISDFPWRTQRPRVVPVREDAPFSLELPVDPPRDPHAQPLEPPGQRDAMRRLGHQMHVIALHGEVHEPEPEPVLSRRKAAGEDRERTLRT